MPSGGGTWPEIADLINRRMAATAAANGRSSVHASAEGALKLAGSSAGGTPRDGGDEIMRQHQAGEASVYRARRRHQSSDGGANISLEDMLSRRSSQSGLRLVTGQRLDAQPLSIRNSGRTRSSGGCTTCVT